MATSLLVQVLELMETQLVASTNIEVAQHGFSPDAGGKLSAEIVAGGGATELYSNTVINQHHALYIRIRGAEMDQVMVAVQQVQDLWKVGSAAWTAMTALSVTMLKPVNEDPPIVMQGTVGVVIADLEFELRTRRNQT